jgi:hypothetical protein
MLVPIVVGQLTPESAREIAGVLRPLLDEDTLVVASSDFTHYGADFDYVPFRDDIRGNLEKLDLGAWSQIEKKDLDGFSKYIDDTGATICGRCPIEVLLAMLPEAAQPHRLHYETSGDSTGDFSHCVDYLCAAFTGAWPKGALAVMTAETNPSLTEDDKKELLKLARGTLTAFLEKGKRPSPEELGVAITPGMEQVMGAFVTLTKNGDLRGCIGEIEPRRALYKAVMDHAVNAGVHDPRFPEVIASELPSLKFEISALTPPVPVASYNDIVIGKHGMVLAKGSRRAVFLPQVAPEQGWDLAQTLTHLSMKAGLSADAWKEGASYTVFEAIVFHEQE